MHVIFDNNQHYDYLDTCVQEKPSHTVIATYGIYAGILFDGRDTSEWGPKYATRTGNILRQLRRQNTKTKILVGLPQYTSCGNKEYCYNCEAKYYKSLLRLLNHADYFNQFAWRLTTELHVKAYLFFYPEGVIKGVSGGRNFTNSPWDDLSFALDAHTIAPIGKYVDACWKAAQPVTTANINALANTAGIADATIAKIINEPETDNEF